MLGLTSKNYSVKWTGCIEMILLNIRDIGIEAKRS